MLHCGDDELVWDVDGAQTETSAGNEESGLPGLRDLKRRTAIENNLVCGQLTSDFYYCLIPNGLR